ncbi:putative protein phosphatase type 1 complex subunit hex2 reg1 [Golovinomyces cichoracearum]|uniref:Nitrogen regulatory protein areA GATA-like domain-containing protein n=1 Tax=Golovinomyces cichoracearum TaxID=62708 RepID=A0A420HW07_9PEZI|nr:putative protein phosphatase type 1 complex subunit hex2 reg1 [Golovinomyces cichoracearum]
MAVVLSSEDNAYFSSGPLRRSQSQPKFLSSTLVYSKSPCRSMSSIGFPNLIAESTGDPLYEESSPRILQPYSSYHMSSEIESPSDSCDMNDEEDPLSFPSYDEVAYYKSSEDSTSPLSPPIEDSYTVSPTLSPTSNSTSSIISRPQSPEFSRHAEDDTAIRIQPSRHVDYLSHNWHEEDIWSSWKHVVSRRKAYNNSARLENASWRSWIKAKYKLKTVSPETLNWLKDCDVTWLYGPLQTVHKSSCYAPSTSPNNENRNGSCCPKSSSFLQKKPILKKRSMSELMLQQSLSSSSLLKQAAAAIQAQQYSKSDEITRTRCIIQTTPIYSLSTRRPSDQQTQYLSSVTSSELPSPVNAEKKRIHFNEQVAQCIAVDVKGDDDDEPLIHDYGDSDSDDGGIMMKPITTKRRYPIPQRKKICPKPSQETNKIIAMLPSTTLKYHPDTPDPHEALMDQCYTESWDECDYLSPSPSQETLRPSKPSLNSFMGAEDEDDEDIDWQPADNFPCRNDIEVETYDRKKSFNFLNSSSDTGCQDNNNNQVGLRRTSSGMFMPYEENDEYSPSEGLFGKVIDTVNTAKDIAHVIWNVGWRR